MIKENERINLILSNEIYKESLINNLKYEKQRKFCHHDIEHFLSVARIAYIINFEKELKLRKDIIYAAALLHDIGRWKQYADGTPHDLASAELAEEILKQSNFEAEEIVDIRNAIITHRSIEGKTSKLQEIIFYADKKSRNCFSCTAVKGCNWAEEKKNYEINY